MKEQLISSETAKLAKEKGWDGDFVESRKILTTQSLLQKWLRDIHKIRVFPTNKFAGDFGFEIYIVNPNQDEIIGKPWIKLIDYWTLHFKTYEEALEKGLQEALKLI